MPSVNYSITDDSTCSNICIANVNSDRASV